MTFPEGIDTTRMLPQARERGVEFAPGPIFFVDGRGTNQLRLSYSFVRDEQVEPGIRIIGEIAKGELLESGSGDGKPAAIERPEFVHPVRGSGGTS